MKVMRWAAIFFLAQSAYSFSSQPTLFDPIRLVANERNRIGALEAGNNRIFNLNESGGPFGGYNAEIWNGRVAQLSFAWVFGQEWLQGKGMLQGIQDQDPSSVIAFGLFMTLVGFLSLRFVAEPPKGASLQQIEENMKQSHPAAFRHAKSFMEMFDPERDLDELTVNFNDQGGVFGFKKTAEIWNGRIAMLSFVWVYAQELVTGKGLIAGIAGKDGDSLAALVCFLTLLTGFTGFITSDENVEKDFVEKVVSREKLLKNVDMNWKPDTIDRPYEPIRSTSREFAVSDPPTYEAYMRERERIAAVEREREYAESLKAMTNPTKAAQQQTPVYQVIQASNPSPNWELSFSDSLRAMTAEKTSKSPPIRAEFEDIPDTPAAPPRKANEVAAPPMIISASTKPTTLETPKVLVKERSPLGVLSSSKTTESDYSMQAYDDAKWSFALAELWNGRFAQIAFVIIFAQEIAQGKGVLRGIQIGDPISIAGMLATILAMVGTGFAFAVGADEGSKAKVSLPARRKDPGLLRQLQSTESNQTLSMSAARVASVAAKTRAKMPTSDPSNFKVGGYRFKEQGDVSPQATGAIKQQNHDVPKAPVTARSSKTVVPATTPGPRDADIIKPPAGFVVKPDPSNFKVQGYRFKSPTQETAPISRLDTSPHPKGVFNFNTGTTRQIRIGSSQKKGPPPVTAFTARSVPPLPLQQSINVPEPPKKIDVVGGPGNSELAFGKAQNNGQAGTWAVDEELDNTSKNMEPALAVVGGSNYLETLTARLDGGGNSRYQP